MWFSALSKLHKESKVKILSGLSPKNMTPAATPAGHRNMWDLNDICIACTSVGKPQGKVRLSLIFTTRGTLVDLQLQWYKMLQLEFSCSFIQQNNRIEMEWDSNPKVLRKFQLVNACPYISKSNSKSAMAITLWKVSVAQNACRNPNDRIDKKLFHFISRLPVFIPQNVKGCHFTDFHITFLQKQSSNDEREWLLTGQLGRWTVDKPSI